MRLIVEGDPQDIKFVTSICRDKVRRGQLTLTPAAETVDDKTVDVGADRKEISLDDVKDAPEQEPKAAPAPTPKRTRSKKSE